jgi:predicted membrane-bound mannosyltransferase
MMNFYRRFLPGITGTLRPFTAALFRKKLSKTEVIYSTFYQELLAAVYGIKHFRSRLEGRPFQLWTDHKPLIFALNRV